EHISESALELPGIPTGEIRAPPLRPEQGVPGEHDFAAAQERAPGCVARTGEHIDPLPTEFETVPPLECVDLLRDLHHAFLETEGIGRRASQKREVGHMDGAACMVGSRYLQGSPHMVIVRMRERNPLDLQVLSLEVR